MKNYIKDIISLIQLGVCPTCKNKNLNMWCLDCQKFNGITKLEVIENNWSKEEFEYQVKSRN